MADGLKQMDKLVKQLFQMSDSYAFREPVDYKGLGLPDYPKVIKKPMDLGTVKANLKKGVYNDAQECADDIRLIWSNCMAYNEDGSEVYLMAERMDKKFDELFSALDAGRAPAAGARHRFGRAFQALESSEELEVNIDAIDAATFWELDRYIKGIIGDDGSSKKRQNSANTANRGNKGKKQRVKN
eukprot:CAMPEP_0194702420 /NCGR_PEP_ID=MMETSP0295-20121207/26877_1 /TAXON_ID=39354 /ORGANISM="Heterosigma akashiwo, Strain CCMP2393" /LENGTH=184 /DNA_ID=CAMNT_0039597011 /DNA_START=154 /DNA_END=708 /DNA_ORIENTATION=-